MTKHARALVLVAHDPDARRRDLAAARGITIQEHLPRRNSIGRERTIGEVRDLLVDPTHG